MRNINWFLLCTLCFVSPSLSPGVNMCVCECLKLNTKETKKTYVHEQCWKLAILFFKYSTNTTCLSFCLKVISFWKLDNFTSVLELWSVLVKHLNLNRNIFSLSSYFLQNDKFLTKVRKQVLKNCISKCWREMVATLNKGD